MAMEVHGTYDGSPATFAVLPQAEADQVVVSTVDGHTSLRVARNSLAFVAFNNGVLTVAYLVKANDNKPFPQVRHLDFSPSPPFNPTSLPTLRFTSPPRHLHFVVNTFAGAKTADNIFQKVIEPLLKLARVPYTVHLTQGEGDAGRIGAELLKTRSAQNHDLNVALMGGDGTTHELLNGILLEESADAGFSPVSAPVNLILFPLGTANALYYHLFPPEVSATPSHSPLATLYSLLSFLCSPNPTPLPLAINTLPFTPRHVVTSVVSSASLHAAILYDAEALRASHPSLERFKIAAQQNATIRTPATLQLHSPAFSYSPSTKSFVSVPADDLVVSGPFAYFVSSLVTRFEATFVVAPHRATSGPLSPSAQDATLDIIVVRPPPDVDPVAFVPTLWGALGGMYAGGAHVDNPLVEYYRCPSFSWTPDSESDSKARLICLDGAIHSLTPHGTLETRALSSSDTGVRVWA